MSAKSPIRRPFVNAVIMIVGVLLVVIPMTGLFSHWSVLLGIPAGLLLILIGGISRWVDDDARFTPVVHRQMSTKAQVSGSSLSNGRRQHRYQDSTASSAAISASIASSGSSSGSCGGGFSGGDGGGSCM